MPFCGNCGKKFTDKEKFCPYCGAMNELYQEETSEAIATQIARAGDYSEDARQQNLDPQNITVGTIIDDRYEIREKLGRGEFCTVYLVWDRDAECEKALKFIHKRYYNDTEVIEHLKKEALFLMQVISDNIVRVWDIHFGEDMKYIDLEYLIGENLADILKETDNGLAESKVLNIARQLVNAVTQLNVDNLPGFSFKPEKIIITDSGMVKIMEFGIGEEQAFNKPAIWTFGRLIHELLTGHSPYDIEPDKEISTLEIRPYHANPEFSQKINVLLTKCLALESEKRFNDFPEIKNFLLANSPDIEPCEIEIPEESPSENKKDLDIIDNVDADLRLPYDTGYERLVKKKFKVINIVLISLVIVAIVIIYMYFRSERIANDHDAVRGELMKYGEEISKIALYARMNENVLRELQPWDEELLASELNWEDNSKTTNFATYTYFIINAGEIRLAAVGYKKGYDRSNKINMELIIDFTKPYPNAEIIINN
ncbi:MAG: protein kinase family protein [Candidatus Stygibacter australis]|nr:protein kinase family protein [Candidatus Stygibacter australis]